MTQEQKEHWVIRGLGGVNLVTLILGVVTIVALYYEIDKEIALIKQNQASIERRLDTFSATLTSIRDEMRRSQPAYSWPPADRDSFGGDHGRR